MIDAFLLNITVEIKKYNNNIKPKKQVDTNYNIYKPFHTTFTVKNHFHFFLSLKKNVKMGKCHLCFILKVNITNSDGGPVHARIPIHANPQFLENL